MSETALTRVLCAKLTAYSCEVYPLIGSTLAPTGWPDRYICHKDWQGFIEFKLHNTWLSKEQEQRCIKLLERNVRVVVCRVDVSEIWSVQKVMLFRYDTPQELICKLN